MTKYEAVRWCAKDLLIDIDGSLEKFKCHKKFRGLSFEDILELRKVLYHFKIEEFDKAKKLAQNLDTHIQEILPSIIQKYIEE